MEELPMIGYPIGLWDIVNNLPIFRRGYAISHLAFDFNERGIYVADIAFFPSSSGSPIYIFNETDIATKKQYFLGTSRVILLGY